MKKKLEIKSWINYVFFPTNNEKGLNSLNELVRNDSNNENWPTISSFVKMVQNWKDNWIDTQDHLSQLPKNGLTKKELEIVKSREIVLQKREKNSITFVWIPRRNLDGKLFLTEIDNFLFNYLGEWYEVKNWEQLSFQKSSVVITAVKSIFYNYYWKLANTGVNGIIHYSPHAKVEICSCSDYGKTDVFYNLIANYELDLKLNKVDKKYFSSDTSVKILDDRVPMVVGSLPTKPVEDITQEERSNLTVNEYSLLGSELGESLFENTRKIVDWKFVGEWNEDEVKFDLSNFGLKEVLEQWDLLNEKYNHFLQNHITAFLYWRGQKIWEGNFWSIFNGLIVNESVNASGNCITLEAEERILTQINESINSKVEPNEITSKIINIATGASIVGLGLATGGVGTAIGGTALFAAKSALGKFSNPTNNSGIIQQHTFYQFQHKFFYGGINPLSLRISFNQTLFNQYIHKRELKGKNTYDYFNTDKLGDYLDAEGFLKSSIISWNTNFPYESWFREKIEKGVYLYESNVSERYERELPNFKTFSSLGRMNLVPSKNLKEKISIEEIRSLFERTQKRIVIWITGRSVMGSIFPSPDKDYLDSIQNKMYELQSFVQMDEDEILSERENIILLRDFFSQATKTDLFFFPLCEELLSVVDMLLKIGVHSTNVLNRLKRVDFPLTLNISSEKEVVKFDEEDLLNPNKLKE